MEIVIVVGAVAIDAEYFWPYGGLEQWFDDLAGSMQAVDYLQHSRSPGRSSHYSSSGSGFLRKLWDESKTVVAADAAGAVSGAMACSVGGPHGAGTCGLAIALSASAFQAPYQFLTNRLNIYLHGYGMCLPQHVAGMIRIVFGIVLATLAGLLTFEWLIPGSMWTMLPPLGGIAGWLAYQAWVDRSKRRPP
jgi:hypothetical protein